MSPDHRLAGARRLARWTEGLVRIPGTRWTLGLDAILGLLPGIGDLAGALIGAYFPLRAWQLGVRGPVLRRMLLNLALDAAAGSVPILGDLFDAGFRANRRNLELLEQALAPVPEPEPAPARPHPLLLAAVATILVTLALAALLIHFQ